MISTVEWFMTITNVAYLAPFALSLRYKLYDLSALYLSLMTLSTSMHICYDIGQCVTDELAHDGQRSDLLILDIFIALYTMCYTVFNFSKFHLSQIKNSTEDVGGVEYMRKQLISNGIVLIMVISCISVVLFAQINSWQYFIVFGFWLLFSIGTGAPWSRELTWKPIVSIIVATLIALTLYNVTVEYKKHKPTLSLPDWLHVGWHLSGGMTLSLYTQIFHVYRK